MLTSLMLAKRSECNSDVRQTDEKQKFQKNSEALNDFNLNE